MSKIIRVQDGDYKIIVNRTNIDANPNPDNNETNDNIDRGGNIILNTGPQDGDGYGIGNTFISGDLTVDGGDIYSTNYEFNLLNRQTSQSTTEDGPRVIRAFENATTLSINDNTTNSSANHEITIGNSLANQQQIRIGSYNTSISSQQNIAIGTDVSTPSQGLYLGSTLVGNSSQTVLVASNFTTNSQNVKVSANIVSSSQLVYLATGRASSAQEVHIAENGTSGTYANGQQWIEFGHSYTYSNQGLYIASSSYVGGSQTIQLGASTTVNGTQTFTIGTSSVTPTQNITIGNSLSSNQNQSITIGSSTTASTSQTIKLGDTVTSPTQTFNIGSNGNATSSQTMAIGNAIVTPTQTLNVANLASGNTTQTINVGNSVSPNQTIAIGNGNSTTGQTVNIANLVASSGTQTIKFGSSALTGAQTLGIGNVTSGTTQAINVGNTVVSSSQTVNAFNVTTPTQTINFGNATSSTRQDLTFGTAVTPTQVIKIGDLTSGNTTQTISVGNATNSSSQTITVGSSTSPTQTATIFGGTHTTRQDIYLGVATAPVSTITIGNTTSTTSQTVQQFVSVTPTSSITIGSLASGNTTQTIGIGNSVSSTSQTFNIGSSTTPTQTAGLFNSSSTTRQDITLGNSTTPVQTVKVGQSTAATSQTIEIGIAVTPASVITIGSLASGNTSQTINVGNSVSPTQTIAVGNSTSTTSQVINIGNSTTPSQTINIGTSTVSGSQTVNVGQTAALQTVNIGALSTFGSTYNVGTGTTASGQTKTLNLATNGAAGSTTNVNLATGVGTGGLLTVGSATVVGEETTQNLWNTVATTVNAFGDATTINIGKGAGGSGQGTTTIRHDLVVQGDMTVNGTTTTVNSTVMTVDDKNIELGSTPTPTELTAEGGGVTLRGTTDKTFNWYSVSDAWTSNVNVDLVTGKVYKINNVEVLSSNSVLTFPTSVTAFTSATAINMGATTGTLTVNNPTVVGTQATVNLWNTASTTVNAFGAATAINIGAATGITNIKNKLDVDLDIEVGGNIIPTTNITSDIGSLTNRFRDLYLSGNTIYLGDTQISSDVNAVLNVDHGVKVLGNADFNATGYVKVPKGTEAQRPGEAGQPVAESGQIRFNTTGVYFEGYDGIKWKRLGVDIDSAEQYGSLAPFLMDKYEIAMYKTCEYTIQMSNPLSNHSVKVLVTHNGVYTSFETSNEVIIGAPVATITTRLNNGFVELLLTPVYESTEIEYSRVLLDIADLTTIGGINGFPTDETDTFDLQYTSFILDLETLANSDIDLNASKVPGYGGTLPIAGSNNISVLDLETTSYNIDFDTDLATNLINNNGLVDEVLAGLPVGETDKIDLSMYNYYMHPALSPVLLEAPSTP